MEPSGQRRWLAALLNLFPGFGLGYRLVRRRTAFRVTLIAWALLIALSVASWIWIALPYSGFGRHPPSYYYWVGGQMGLIFGWVAGALLIGVPTAFHLLINALVKKREPTP